MRKNKEIYLSQEKITNELKNLGYIFICFEKITLGDYKTYDADFNYKDLPHLDYIHSNVKQRAAVISDNFYGAINIQKIFGFKIPMTLVNYAFNNNGQIAFSSFLLFVIIIHTNWTETLEGQTKVITKYNIGSPNWISFMLPIIKYSINKNYQRLMQEDLPMRQRRGQLRKIGYEFKLDGEKYSYLNSVNISNNNLITPKIKNKLKINYKELLKNTNNALIGDIGLLGFELIREKENIIIFPRACSHEGADLSLVKCQGKIKICPWHGRKIKPIICFKENADLKENIMNYKIYVYLDILEIEFQ